MKSVFEIRTALLLAVALAGAVAPALAQESISDKMNRWLFGNPVREEANPGNTPAELDCPGVDIRAGASTLSVSAPGAEATPMTTRYQVSIGQTARECAAAGGMMTMRVGVEGRVLLGPMGGPGKLDLPLRMAVVREGPEPKVIWSKFNKLAVTISPGQTAVPFSLVEDSVSFPMARDLDAYVVYVGFDPGAAPQKVEPPRRKKKKK